jgi:hypothetical protein
VHSIYHITSSRSSTRWLIPSSQPCHCRRKAISVRPRPRRSLSAVQRPRPDQTKITFPSLARWQAPSRVIITEQAISVPIVSGQLARLAHSPNRVCDARSPAIAGHAPSLRPPRRALAAASAVCLLGTRKGRGRARARRSESDHPEQRR